MRKKQTYNGETFELDDSKGCYIEITYKDLVGCVGVNPISGTKDRPVSWSIPGYLGAAPTKDGINSGAPARGIEEGLQSLYQTLIRQHQDIESQKAFNPEETCKNLHEFMENLPDG